MHESANTDWREWRRGTSFRGGRERNLEDYEGYLGFKREALEGETILDLGSGETERFSRELNNAGINANVISLNPDYISERYRSEIKDRKNWQKKSVAGIGQELPFKDAMFDRVFALYSVTVFSHPRENPEAAWHWMNEIMRVLKPGGEARLGGILADKVEEVFEGHYKNLLKTLQEMGYKVKVEKVKRIDVKLPQPFNKTNKEGELEDARIIINKPLK